MRAFVRWMLADALKEKKPFRTKTGNRIRAVSGFSFGDFLRLEVCFPREFLSVLSLDKFINFQ